eukprot:TRINITY_DN18121_c0_g1_i1.p1 TRINITY_DN18121_c0_g1~~TRINITY_DN18121_c0_g1_i1.p1  ORF type:complete len:567 (-),score=99.18 TRINITY_DN18121_c0_g1_i1:65-1765(-)
MLRGILALFVLVAGLFIFSSAIPPPTGTPITVSGNVFFNYPLLKVIGAPNFYTKGPSVADTATAGSIATPSRIKFFPAGATANPLFANGGLVGTDTTYSRGVFYPNTIATTGTVGSVAFAQPNLTTSGVTSTLTPLFDPYTQFLDAARGRDIIAFADGNRVFIYNLTDAQFITADAYYYPGAVLGPCNAPNCNNYSTVQAGVSLAADNSRIYYADSGCFKVLVFNLARAAGGVNNPDYALGQTTTRGCDTNSCNATNPVTCISPGVMDTDCYGGIWVLNVPTKNIVHFPNGSNVADFAISNPTSGGFTIDSTTQFSINKQRCSYMAISTSRFHIILNITYSSTGVPSASTVTAVVGSGTTNPNPDNSTNSIGPAAGITWDDTISSNVWIVDTANNRYVTFNPFGAVVPSNSPTSSITPSISTTASLTSSVSVTRSATPSTSFSPSVTPTRSVTPTGSPSISVSSSTSFSSSASPSLGASSTPSASISLSPTNTPTSSVSSTSAPSVSIGASPSTSNSVSISAANSGLNPTSTTPSPLTSFTSDPSVSPAAGGGGAASISSWLSFLL